MDDHDGTIQDEQSDLRTTDPLTGTCNRRQFEYMLRSESARIDRHGGLLCFILFDLDNFGAVNKRFGFHAGNELLRELAAVVKRNIRASDHLARWEGQRFAILAPYLQLTEATGFAVKLRRLISEYRFGRVGSLTASFGVVQYRVDEPMESLLTRATGAMYKAKNNGGNRIHADKLA